MCAMPTNGVRDSLDCKGERGGKAEWHGRQKADGNYSDDRREKGGLKFSRKRRQYLTTAKYY